MQNPPIRPPREAVLAVALVAFSILAAEVALTRVFSVLFRAPYVFLIVSGAIGGLGIGGLLAYGIRPREERLRDWIAGLSAAFALALAAPTLLLFASPWGRDLVAQAETAVVVALPMVTFALAGMLLSLVFRQYAGSGGFLYFVDLGAAALGAPASVLLLDRLGGINTPLALAAGTALAGAGLAFQARRPGWAGGCLCLVFLSVGVLGSNLVHRWIDLPPLKTPPAAVGDPSHTWYMTTKPLFSELADPFSSSRIVRTDWTAVSRTDVVRDGSGELFYIYTDGDVPTQMEVWDGSLDRARRAYGEFIGMLPFRLLGRAPDSVLAIGSGGGLDVLLARAAGAKRVDAVEINPSMPAIVADPQFRETYARIYREPGVRLLVDEGRSFLQRAGRYDVIYFACAKTATTQTSGVALLDNHLYTVEAFGDYWRHLTDTGIVALVAQESFLIDRLLLTALTALRSQGVPESEAGQHLLTVRVPPERFMLGPYRHALLLRRQPWRATEVAGVSRAIAETGLEPLHVPHLQSRGAGGATLPSEASLPALRVALEEQYPVPASASGAGGGRDARPNLAPVTDDSPFYVDIARGLHPTLAGLLQGSVLASLLAMGLVMVCGTAVLRKSEAGDRGRSGWGRSANLARCTLYFALLGAGFMLVELALMQRFILLLGFPTRSLTVTLCALLVSSAVGSMLSQRGAPADARRLLRVTLPGLVLIILAYRFFLPPLLDTLLAWPLWARVAATAGLLFPPGVLMGMPFPAALRNLEGAYNRIFPLFWTVNGVTSILGSVGVMAVAKLSGYGAALLTGAACYLAAWLLFPPDTTADFRSAAAPLGSAGPHSGAGFHPEDGVAEV